MDLFGFRRRRYRKELDKLGLDPGERALIEEEFARGDNDAATARIERSQERRRAEFAARTGIDPRMIVPLVGQQISWTDVVRQVFRVRDFDRAGTTVDSNDRVKASRTQPYGFLLVESPILNQPIRLPIIHRDDFLLATTVFDEPKLVEALSAEVELLVTYGPKRVLPGGLSGSPSHVLHYVLVPPGTLERYYSMDGDRHMASPAPEKLFGNFVYDGEIKVQVIPDPAL
jgi:hypothetical protein